MIKEQFSNKKHLDYMFKYNLNLILIYCTIFTLYIISGILYNYTKETFISHATGILLAYLLLVVAGIWVQRKRKNTRLYYEMLFVLFYVSTIISMFAFAYDFKSNMGFILMGIIVLQLFSSFLYMPPLLNVIIMLIVSSNGITSIIRVDGDPLFIITIVILMFGAMYGSYINYTHLMKHFENEEIINNLNSMLRNVSKVDQLTDLYNNEFIYDQLDFEIKRAGRYNSPLCLLKMDIDNFKRINNNYGQVVGDDVISTIGNILTNTCRTTDILGRFSGEEFIIVLPNTSLDDSIILAERIRITINSHNFGIDSNVTVSLGLVEFNNHTRKEMIDSSDLNLKVSKSEGYNRINY